MSLLPILKFPDPRLKIVAAPVDEVNTEIQELITNMFETMYESQGIGLAAVQVNVPKRVIVIDLEFDKVNALVLINPVITSHAGTVSSEEGCLSLPGVFAPVQRHQTVTVDFLDQTGKKQTLAAEKLLSICIQHEIDHLNGITFYDHLSSLKQTMIRSKLEKMKKHTL